MIAPFAIATFLAASIAANPSYSKTTPCPTSTIRTESDPPYVSKAPEPRYKSKAPHTLEPSPCETVSVESDPPYVSKAPEPRYKSKAPHTPEPTPCDPDERTASPTPYQSKEPYTATPTPYVTVEQPEVPPYETKLPKDGYGGNPDLYSGSKANTAATILGFIVLSLMV